MVARTTRWSGGVAGEGGGVCARINILTCELSLTSNNRKVEII